MHHIRLSITFVSPPEAMEWRGKGKLIMKTITLTQEQLNSIIAVAFKNGEIWGVTYYTWFTPTEADTLNKIVECQDSITVDLF